MSGIELIRNWTKAANLASEDKAGEEIFKKYDSSADNLLEKSELLPFLQDYFKEVAELEVDSETLNNVADRAIQESDKDGDNKISFAEWQDFLRRLRDDLAE